jgi:hypothetical protein
MIFSAGKKSEVCWGDDNWIFLDIGFSNSGRTCGIAFSDESPQNLYYGDARRAIVNKIRERNGSINLVIEAPISVCFDNHGNPKGRRIEKRDSRTRYWYTGLGCAVMTAAMYLIRDIYEATKDLPDIEVRLFEGFVSFKEVGTDNRNDVRDLREMVQNAQQREGSICGPNELKCNEGDEICGAFRVAGLGRSCGNHRFAACPVLGPSSGEGRMTDAIHSSAEDRWRPRRRWSRNQIGSRNPLVQGGENRATGARELHQMPVRYLSGSLHPCGKGRNIVAIREK